MNVPRLRFKGFSGEWEVKKLDELADITTGNKDTQNKVDDGKYPFFVRSQTIEKINSFSYDGEAILTSGDGVGVGKNFHYINGKFDYHQRVYCIFNFKNQVLGKYIFFYFSEKFNKRVMRLSAKNSVDSVRRDMITDMSTHIPPLPEQTKIANFLTAVDEKIVQLTEKSDLLTRYKKGVMQQIFSQQLRFKDDDGQEFLEWEEKSLKDVLDIVIDNRGKTPPVESNGYPLLEVNAIGNKKINYKVVSKFVSDESYKNWFRKHLKSGDVLFSTVGGTAQCSFYEEECLAVIAQNIVGLRFKKSYSALFMFYLLTEEINNSKFKKIEMIAVQPSIKVSQMIHLLFNFPSLPEQTKIANFLTVLDEKISHNQTQLNALKQYKQGLLQQMFV